MLRREDPGGERHEHRPQPDPCRDSQRSCHRGIDPALGRERADELRAAHADGTSHPELRLALGSEHDEEVHEQQQAGENTEAPHRGEHRREPLPHRLGHIERRPLDRVDLRAELFRGRGGTDPRADLVCEQRSVLHAAAVGDRDAPGRQCAASAARSNDVERLRARRARCAPPAQGRARTRQRRGAAGHGRRGATSESRTRGQRSVRPPRRRALERRQW